MKIYDAKIAVMIADGYEQSQLDGPVEELEKAGALVEIISVGQESLKDGIQGFNRLKPALRIEADRTIFDATPDQYHALLIPGGALSLDRMRQSSHHLAWLKNFFDAQKPVAVIGHGALILADANVARGMTLTSNPSIRKDLERAGAIWHDQELVQDRNLISARRTADLMAFNAAFIREISQFMNQGSRAA